MTGSTLAPIVIAIAVSAGLAAWLVMVYYAASHPEWKRDRLAAAQPRAGLAAAAGPGAPGRDRRAVAAAGPAPQERADRTGGPQVPHAA